MFVHLAKSTLCTLALHVCSLQAKIKHATPMCILQKAPHSILHGYAMRAHTKTHALQPISINLPSPSVRCLGFFCFSAGMRVKLSDHVPGFIRDLSEPAHANKYGGYARPPPLIGTIVRVVGDPLEQKREHRQRILKSSIIGIFLRCNSQQNADCFSNFAASNTRDAGSLC
jgi:hypothetical protein